MPDKGDIISKMQGGNPISDRSFGIYTKASLELLKEIKDNTKNLSSDKKEKKSFFKKEDPNKFVDQIEPLLEEQNKLQKENLKLQKEQKKKDEKGLLGLLGGIASLAAGALAVGGLIGFLLTGKQEFLFSVIKGFKKLFFDIPAMMGKMLKGMLQTPKILSKAKKVVKGVGTIASKAKKVVKSVGRVTKAFKYGGIRGAGKAISRMGKASKLDKTAASIATKTAGKALGKSVLKKIPVVGSLLALWFAIERFKKGDVVGGLLEIGSGIASIFPGPGTMISLLIDGILLMRDFKGVMKSGEKKESKFATNAKKFGMAVLKSLPGIGTIIHFIEAFKLWKTDKVNAIKEIAMGVISVIPGFGLIANPILSFIDTFAKGGLIGATKGILSTAAKVFINPIGAVKDLFKKEDKVDAVTGADKKVIPPAKKPSFMSKLGQKLLNISKSAHDRSEQFATTTEPGKDIQTGIKSKSDVDISGIQPSVWSKFTQMADEYNKMTGKSILMTSGFRSFEEQQKLFNKYGPGRAAPPGRSMHNFGYAIDIDNRMTRAGDTLETSGLLKKYGFTRPMAHEPWHIEPVGLKQQYANIQGGGKMVDSGDQQVGDAYAIKNLPKTSIPVQSQSNKSSELNLSDETIKALAAAIGISFKGALPTSRPNQVSIDMGVRG